MRLPAVLSLWSLRFWNYVPQSLRDTAADSVRSLLYNLRLQLHLVLLGGLLLTLFSVMVGICNFGRSEDLGERVPSKSLPALNAARSVSGESAELRMLGLTLLADIDPAGDSPGGILGRMGSGLGSSGGSPNMVAGSFMDRAHRLADTIVLIGENRDALRETRLAAVSLRSQILLGGDFTEEDSILLLRALSARDQAVLDGLLAEVLALPDPPESPEWAELSVGDMGVFVVRARQLVLGESRERLASDFGEHSLVLGERADALVRSAGENLVGDVGSAVGGFGSGSMLLTLAAVLSFMLAVLSAVFLVELRLVRRVYGLPGGDAAGPVPEVDGDDVGVAG